MTDKVSIPPFVVDLANEAIHRHGREIRLRRKTFALLRYLLGNRDRLLTKDEILDRVWEDTHVGEAVLKVNISQLRKIFRECGELEIATVHGRGYRVRLDKTAAASSGRPAAHVLGSRPLIGRARELQTLGESFVAALRGQRQIVFLGGAAGIGKTAFVNAFVPQIEQFSSLVGMASRSWVGRSQCLPVPGTAEPLRPVLSALANIQPRQAGGPLSDLLRRFAPHLPDEGDVVACEPFPARPESIQEALTAQLEELSSARPLVLILEDLQWSDLPTCALLASLFHRSTPSHLLVVATYRVGEVASHNHPLATVLRELNMACPSSARTLILEPLDRSEVAEIVNGQLGVAPEDLTTFLFGRSRGNPLFVDRLLADLQTSGALQRREDGWTFAADRIAPGSVPEDLEHFIVAQLDQLERNFRRALQAASVAGTTFMAQDVAAILGLTVEEVESVCDDLARRHELLDMSGVTSRSDGVVCTEYQFRHPLFQNVLYDRLPAVIRQSFHLRLATHLEASYGEAASLNAHELALHFERGGDPARTMHYLRVAAHVAVRRGMLADARAYLKDVVQMLEVAPTSGTRLDVDTELARLLVICSGPTAETQAVVERALQLAQSSPRPDSNTAAAIPTFMLFAMHVVEGNFHAAYEVAQALCGLQADVSPEAQTALGVAKYAMHRPAAAIEALQTVLGGAAPVHGLTLDHVMIAHAVLALSSFQTGNVRLAHESRDVALQRALASEAPLNHTVGLGFLTELHLLANQWEWASHLATQTITISTKHDLRSFAGQAHFAKGWASFESGRYEDGLHRMMSALHTCKTTAHGLGLPYLLALYATAQAHTGAIEAGLQSVEEGLALIKQTGEARTEPEIHRLKAHILLRSRKRRDQARALATLSTALDCARLHGSHLFQLRAAIDLAHLLRKKDRTAARVALQHALGFIDPAVEARELRTARDLLEQLG